MTSKISTQRLLIVLSIGAIAFSLVPISLPAFAQSEFIKDTNSVEQAGLRVNQTGSGIPVRLKIPKIKIYALVDPVGVMANGGMEAPDGPLNVGWFRFGPRPGDSGSAVIAGHYGPWKKGGGSVFDYLNKLKKGDKLYVQDEKGRNVTFVVRKVLIYGRNDDASDVFGSGDGKAHLNLITCMGIWDKAKKTYSNRLVVFTDRE